ncbi:phosphoglycerate mutase [Paenibacillus solani]|uniref:Phosphoglycerate mutase n=1 Tax=Paenibacillus solani TaxID=1705565 RepID=A0A0M1P7T7_9BACL|nr:histidine phosphatase family protein [Paenibacillus solani]KOR90104.1 phosphoglycerate mutase [Paenibacillus solani]
MTILYFVRHAESPFIEGKERARGLSVEGVRAAERVKDLLLKEDIDVVIASSYQRAKDTIQPLADALALPIEEYEDLRERKVGDFQGYSFLEAKEKLFQDFAYSFPGGESSTTAQSRAVRMIEEVLNEYSGKRIVIGTHGDIMTLMLNHYDQRFDYHFWQGTTMPDIYRVEFDEGQLVHIARLWSSN